MISHNKNNYKKLSEQAMERATEQFHQDVYNNMVAIYKTVPIDRDGNLRKMRQLLHDAEVQMAKQDMTMDDMYKHYTKKLFPDGMAVATDDTICYKVLHDIITTAFGCDTIGNTKETEFEVVRVRKSYLNSLFVADPMAKENIKLTSQN